MTIRDGFAVHKNAAGRVRRKGMHKNGDVATVRVNKKALAKALRLVGGDARYLQANHDGSITILNNPRNGGE